jgi:hypothetical protein
MYCVGWMVTTVSVVECPTRERRKATPSCGLFIAGCCGTARMAGQTHSCLRVTRKDRNASNQQMARRRLGSQPVVDGESYSPPVKPNVEKLPPPPSAPVRKLPVHPRHKAAARRR